MNSPPMRAHFGSFRCRTRWRCGLREAGVAPEVVSEYVGVDEAALDGVYRIAEAKLSAAEDPRCQELVENSRTWPQSAQ